MASRKWTSASRGGREGPPVPGFSLREIPHLVASRRQQGQGLRGGWLGFKNLAGETIRRREIPGLEALAGEIQELGSRGHDSSENFL